MFEVKGLHDGLSVLVAVLCVIIAHRYYVSFSQISRVDTKPQDPLPPGGLTPEVPGNHLYYGRTRWPQYEATFNLRLSYLYGPVVPIKLVPESLLARAVRWVNAALCRGWRHSDTTILINSLSENEASLKKLLGSCASRSPSMAAGKHLSRGRRIVLQPYGPDWIRHRRAFASLLTKEKINARWARVLRFEAMVMVDRIASLGPVVGPSCLSALDEISRFTASSVLQITYARRALTPRDQALRDLETVSRNIASAFTSGRYWIDEFPILDMFPPIISPWKRKLDAAHRFELGLFRSLLQGVESTLNGNKDESEDPNIHAVNTAGECVLVPEECAAAELLRNREHLQLDRDDIAYLAAGIFEAGTETTAMTIGTFLLAAASSPAMTRRAQAEIDGVVARRKRCPEDSAPTFEDLHQMPYLAGVVKEALRLTPTGSSGVGHTPTRAVAQSLELEYKDGREPMRLNVPAGATVLANTYGLHHDPGQFPDPWRFNPGRWLPADPPATRCPSEAQHLEAPNVLLDHTHAAYAFGFGRRICPGSSLASYSLSISIAMLLLCFDFELTDQARLHYVEMEKQRLEEHGKWSDLFPTSGTDSLRTERFLQDDSSDEQEHMGRILIDAHIAFKLSRAQLAECIHLRPRKQDHGVKAVREALAMMQYS